MRLEIIKNGEKYGVRRVINFLFFKKYLYFTLWYDYDGSDRAWSKERVNANVFSTIDSARRAVEKINDYHYPRPLDVVETYVCGKIFTKKQKEDILKLTSLMLDLDRDGRVDEANEVHDRIQKILM